MSTIELGFRERAPAIESPAETPLRRGRIRQLLPPLLGGGLLLLDLALISSAFLLAYWVRFIVPDVETSALGLEQYTRLALAVALATVVLFGLQGLYDLERRQPWPARLYTVLSAVSIAMVLTVAASFLLGDQRFSRLWFAAGWTFSVVGLAVWRTLAQPLCAAVHDAVAPADHVLIVGANRLGEDIAGDLQGQYRVVGFVDNGSDLDGLPAVPHLGPIARLEQLVQAYGVDEIIIALPPSRLDQVVNIIARGFRRPVRVKFSSDLHDLLPQRVEVDQLAGRPYIGFATAARVGWTKRLFDLVSGGLILLALLPVFVLVAIAIKLDSPGPVFYRQERVGKHGRRFRIYKFRSMRRDADRLLEALRHRNEASGPLFKIRRDPRITRVGQILRRTSLDELPQLFNVLRGEMSLVGPRPPIPAEVEQYEDWQHGRLRALPGITGLWQVSGRSDVSFHDMVRLDLHYIRNWSLSLDFEILVRTIPAVLTNRGAY